MYVYVYIYIYMWSASMSSMVSEMIDFAEPRVEADFSTPRPTVCRYGYHYYCD